MSLFECKMCGGALEFTEGAAVAKCKYCGTAQTLPQTVDEIMQNLFVRANALRLKNEFDKAEKIYERIIQNDPTQSEAYWGLILCKYGIEYVDDPETKQKIPTCHRASYDSIIADDDFRLALEYADEDQRAVLDEQAREIDRIQKEILALAQKEETYDVFICYKETDENGKRTRDSVIANDIYYQLKQEGFKVFYAAITLENKLGSAYEPIIFAALHSAKVMLALGTKPEYFNAVWVKNEWSRYLKIIQKDRSKLLIPCYRDMDAYELPDEFAHLQAQDMAKIGFINDLVRGIRKVVKKDAPKAAAVPVSSSPNTSALLKRAFICLEDGDWSQADDFCEKVLNQDPENAQAYLGKLMAELHVSKQTMLEHCETPFDTNHNYMKAVRFADDALKTTLEGYAEAVRNRNQKMVAKKSKRKKKVALVIIPLVSLLVAAALVLNAFVVPKNEQSNDEPIPPSVTDSQALDATTQATEATTKAPEATTQAPETTTTTESADIVYFEGLEYTISQNAITLTSIGSCTASDIVIPSEINGLPVTSIGGAVFRNCSQLTSISIPNGITSIGNYAFSNCSNLTSISLPDSLISIENYVFPNCSKLTSITIPEGITSIGSYAFSDCTALTSISIPDSVTSIGSYAFNGCSHLTSISIPIGVSRIEKNSFTNCKRLTSISIPNSVKNIATYAFRNCSGLTNVTYGGTIEQWKKIPIASGNDPLQNATIHCTDGDIIPQ